MTTSASDHVAALRSGFASGITRHAGWRRSQLRKLDRMLTERAGDFEAALCHDLGKSVAETHLTEIGVVQSEIDVALRGLRSWMKPTRAHTPPALWPATAGTTPEPLGTVLIIAPWNYPLMLVLAPLVGALAAGNTVLIKPSELAPATSAALARFLPRYLDERAVRVAEGGPAETTAILTERFDHMFFTGSARVGRIIAEAASKHLTPVTLELGGKSPAFVDASVDIERAALRLAWAKFLNAGQSCVAPDYVLGEPAVLKKLEPALRRAIHSLYGTASEANPDYGRIVNEHHFTRLVGLLGSGRVVTGGTHRRADRFIAPTVIADVPRDAPIMQEEIFGPILPLLPVTGIDDAVAEVRSREKPLSITVFSEDPSTRERWKTQTSSGALLFNAPLLHVSVSDLPFGGVGHSGMGSYHGKHSFDLFSHHKAILDKPLTPDTLRPTIMPPFSRIKTDLVRRILRHFR